MRQSCENKVLIARKRLEEKVLETLNVEVLKPELLERIAELVMSEPEKALALIAALLK